GPGPRRLDRRSSHHRPAPLRHRRHGSGGCRRSRAARARPRAVADRRSLRAPDGAPAGHRGHRGRHRGGRSRVPGCRARGRGRMNDMTDGAAALLQEFGAADACVARLLCDDHPPDHVAFTVVEPDLSARELTYGELTHESARFAEALADLGIGPGDRVAVLMGRSIEHIVTLLAIWRRGAVLVPLSTALGRPGIAARLRAADVALVVVDADRRAKLAAGEGVPADPRWQVVVVRGEPGRRELSFEALMALYLDDSLLVPVAAGGDGPLALVFTAGTTGPPKAVPVPVRALAAFATARLAAGPVDDERPLDVHWDTGDPGWATGLYSAV